MRFSTMMIGLLLVGFFATGFGFLYYSVGTTYNVEFDNSTFQPFQNKAEIDQVIAQMNETVREPRDSSGGFNIIGDYLATGVDTLKATFSAFDVFSSITFYGLGEIPGLENNATIVAAVIVGIALIAFIAKFIEMFINREV